MIHKNYRSFLSVDLSVGVFPRCTASLPGGGVAYQQATPQQGRTKPHSQSAEGETPETGHRCDEEKRLSHAVKEDSGLYVVESMLKYNKPL